MSDHKNYRLGFWLAIGAAVGFSAKAIFVKLAYSMPVGVGGVLAIDAVTLLALRMLFAAPAFGVAALRTRGGVSLDAKQWVGLVGVGLAGYYGASILDFWGLMFISAGLERLILFTYPSLTLLISAVFLGKQLKRRDWLAVLLTYIGIAAAFAHDFSVSDNGQAIWIGSALVFLSSLSYAIYLTGGGELINKLGSARFTAMAMFVATFATFIHYLVSRPWLEIFNQSQEIYALALGMAAFSTVIPVFMQSAAIRYIGASRASLVGMLGPVATIFLSWWLLNEPLSFWQAGGAIFVIGGVALISRR